jgi:hypothetical protein
MEPYLLLDGHISIFLWAQKAQLLLVSKEAVVKKTRVRNRARDQLEFYAI